MRVLAFLGVAVAALALANPAAAGPKDGPIKWIENWADAAKAAKAKGTVIFVYVHRFKPD